MKIVTNGTIFEVRGDSIKIHDKLPAQTYIIRFDKSSGFYMEKYPDIHVNEEKIYGVHNDKVAKVLNSFDNFERNLGIILSGRKGIGKSLFAKLLAENAISRGLPLIIVDSFIPGIAAFIEKIDQEVVVLFDEFDKTFGNISVSDNEVDPQASLLSLFDGVSQGKKLFVITCNELRALNDYLVNRPGRFHYHFRFDYPNAEEISEYLKDKLNEQYYSEINKVISFSRKISLNYDCLRSIAYELNTGEPFESAIKDLNIININEERYNLILYFTNNEIMTAHHERLDLFSGEVVTCDVDDKDGRSLIEVGFCPSDCIYDPVKDIHIVQADKLKIDYADYYSDEMIDRVKALTADYLVIERYREKDIHYVL